MILSSSDVTHSVNLCHISTVLRIGALDGQGFLAALAARNAVPAKQFSKVEAIDMRQRVQPMNVGSDRLCFDVI
jgi:hypothetical protein